MIADPACDMPARTLERAKARLRGDGSFVPFDESESVWRNAAETVREAR
jgi:hypothetical protein